MNYDWNFGRLSPYWGAFLTGAGTTLVLTALVIVIGTVLGIGTGLLLRRRTARMVLYPLIDVLRALPPLVLILFMYYLLTRQVIGYAVPAFWVCTVAMSLNLAAFTSELVRSATEAVPATYVDAARALGMSERQVVRHIIFPHVARELVPAMTVLYIGMLKMSSLASVIAVREVVFAAQTVVAEVSRSLEAWTIVALVYLVLVIPSVHLARFLEKRLTRGRRGTA